jgi:prevent-host-death family protein
MLAKLHSSLYAQNEVVAESVSGVICKKEGAEIMTSIVPALTARTQFGQILRRVKQNKERFIVDKRGEPQAVIMSVEDYLRKFANRPPSAIAAVRREARAKRLDQLSLREINLEIRRTRREGRLAGR